MYRIELTPKAEEELRALGRSGDKASIKKVYRMFEELRVHPYEVQAGRNLSWAIMRAIGRAA